MQKKLTKLQAYNVMLYFLEDLYQKNKSENLSDFITYAFFWFDKKTADPAAWPEWQDSLKKTIHQDHKLIISKKLNYTQALHVMINFFELYCSGYHTIPEDMQEILNILKILKQKKQQSEMWCTWINIVDQITIQKDPRMYIEKT